MTTFSSPSGANGRRAVVIGGSLGGLTAAALLLDEGWDVSVFERSPVLLDGAGAGIVVHEATVRYLVERQKASLADISCGSSVVRTYGPHGVVLHEEPSHYRFTSWTTLYRGLLNSVGLNRYSLNECLESLSQDDDQVEVRFASGRSDKADLVVCADGIGSTARRLLAGEIEPTYSGYVGWRGLVERDEVSEETYNELRDALTFGVVDSSHIVAYPIPISQSGQGAQDDTLNYVWYRNVEPGTEFESLMTGCDGITRSISLLPGNVQESFLTELREDARAAFAGSLAELVVQTKQPFLQSIVDIESPRMVYGRVAITGDAAFAARPHAAAGTAKAAENAWTLVEALRKANGDLKEALEEWEPTQLDLGRKLVARARVVGERAQITNTWTPGDPELRFGLYGPDH